MHKRINLETAFCIVTSERYFRSCERTSFRMNCERREFRCEFSATTVLILSNYPGRIVIVGCGFKQVNLSVCNGGGKSHPLSLTRTARICCMFYTPHSSSNAIAGANEKHEHVYTVASSTDGSFSYTPYASRRTSHFSSAISSSSHLRATKGSRHRGNVSLKCVVTSTYFTRHRNRLNASTCANVTTDDRHGCLENVVVSIFFLGIKKS